MKIKGIFVEELSEAICALANEPEGGWLLICEKHSNSNIREGIRNFTQKEFDKFKSDVESSLKLVAFHKNIQVKVEALPIYEKLSDKIQGKGSE